MPNTFAEAQKVENSNRDSKGIILKMEPQGLLGYKNLLSA